MTITKAIILSAGQGSRLLPLTRDVPKCMIDFNGRTLISWQIAALVANGVTDIVVVTGFRTERVEDHALQLYRETGARIRCVFNPFFQVADNLGTCWIVREEMDRDFIILNGDTIVSDEIVAKLIAGTQDAITVTVDVKPDYDDDDMKVNRDESGRLHHIGKRLLPPDTNAESIGMLAFTGEGPAIFRNQIDQMMRTPEGVERWYLRAIDIIAKGNRVGTVSIEGLEWQEVDFHQDVEAATALTAKWVAPRGATGDKSGGRQRDCRLLHFVIENEFSATLLHCPAHCRA
jgi:choline kinase